MNNGNKEPNRESILRVLKEQYKNDNDIFLTAKEIHTRLIKHKIDIKLENMYRTLDNLSSYGYVDVLMEKNCNDGIYRRTFRYNPH